MPPELNVVEPPTLVSAVTMSGRQLGSCGVGLLGVSSCVNTELRCQRLLPGEEIAFELDGEIECRAGDRCATLDRLIEMGEGAQVKRRASAEWSRRRWCHAIEAIARLCATSGYAPIDLVGADAVQVGRRSGDITPRAGDAVERCRCEPVTPSAAA
jgi:hypothetical protein